MQCPGLGYVKVILISQCLISQLQITKSDETQQTGRFI